MQVTGTREAFLALISQRGFAGKFGFDKTIVSQWRSLKRVPTLDMMEEVLKKSAAKVVSEKVWDINLSK